MVELSGWEFESRSSHKVFFRSKKCRIGNTGVTSSNKNTNVIKNVLFRISKGGHCWALYSNEVVVYTFLSKRVISIIQKHSKLWPFSPVNVYDVWVLLKHAPYWYVSPSFLSMLTQYVYNTMGYFRKKHWDSGHGISGCKRSENM